MPVFTAVCGAEFLCLHQMKAPWFSYSIRQFDLCLLPPFFVCILIIVNYIFQELTQNCFDKTKLSARLEHRQIKHHCYSYMVKLSYNRSFVC